MNLFLIQFPKIISDDIEKSTIHLIETKMIYFIEALLRYTDVSYNPIILVRPYLKENKFKVVIRCKYLDIFLKKYLKFGNKIHNLQYYSRVLCYVYFFSIK